MEPTEQAAAHCAAHEGAQATGTCERCGSYVCPLCLDEASAFPELCAACREHEGAELMAWERPGDGWAKRWARTGRDLFVSPTATFERTRPGAWSAPVAFNAVTSFGIGLAVTLLMLCMLGLVLGLGILPGDDLGAIGGAEAGIAAAVIAGLVVFYPLFFVAMSLVTQAILATVYHLAALALGGKGGFGTSSWAIGYLSIGQLAMLPLWILSNIPILGPMIGLLGYAFLGIWGSIHLTTVARHHHGLEGGRAALAGWAPFLSLVALSTLTCVALGALAFLGRM